MAIKIQPTRVYDKICQRFDSSIHWHSYVIYYPLMPMHATPTRQLNSLPEDVSIMFELDTHEDVYLYALR